MSVRPLCIATHRFAVAFAATIALCPLAHAGISGVNTPGSSNGSIIFDDTFSVAPPAGVTVTGPAVSPWNGSPVVLTLTTDPNTGDFAVGTMDATFVLSSNTYALNFTGITLDQAVGNTGSAHLIFNFNVEYQLDALGLPSQPTLYPNFVVNGTVQSTAGSFASINGFIDYSGVNTAGTISVVETVNYNSLWTTPGPFTGTAFGIPVSGTTPALVGFTTLTLSGVIIFTVDPATINAFSVQSVPSPSAASAITALLMPGLAATGRSRHRRRCTLHRAPC